MNAYIVEAQALRQNVRAMKNASSAVLWAVVKGNGYGLGVDALTRLLLEEDVSHFAVTEAAEAEVIHQLSAQAEILMLRPSCDLSTLEQLLCLNAICTISSLDDAAVLSAIAQSRDRTARVHLKIDTAWADMASDATNWQSWRRFISCQTFRSAEHIPIFTAHFAIIPRLKSSLSVFKPCWKPSGKQGSTLVCATAATAARL